jgi:cation diffusion facilitator CzcD-associated flavoprotein CzcO
MSETVEVAIIGAGLGGLAMAAQLTASGQSDFTVLEKEDAVGGTWRDNTYPGCACDVPVSLYQYSFAPSLAWSHIYPRAAQVQQYADYIVDLFGYRDRLRLGDGAASAVWNEGKARWIVTADSGATYEAQHLVAALGQLNRPLIPDIPGRDTFGGPSFHSARWRHDVDLKGKRVGVIGSAASAVQFIPEIAMEAGRLAIFQRSANWIVPRMDREIYDEEKALLMTAPEIAMMGREQVYLTAEMLAWQAFSYTEVGRAAYTKTATMHLHRHIADPELRAKLTPDYPVGCKRILVCDDYYPTLTQPHVRLVTEGIDAITPAGVRTRDGEEHPLDVLIFATGFETTAWHWSMDVTGAGGLRLQDAWAEGPESYLGITTAGFPNLFMLYGPNTNLGHNSITFMIERQVDYILKAMDALKQASADALDVTPEAQAAFNAALQEKLARTTWADPHCVSWYKTASGKITQNWSGDTRAYAAAVKDVRLEDYRLIRAPALAG